MLVILSDNDLQATKLGNMGYIDIRGTFQKFLDFVCGIFILGIFQVYLVRIYLVMILIKLSNFIKIIFMVALFMVTMTIWHSGYWSRQ